MSIAQEHLATEIESLYIGDFLHGRLAGIFWHSLLKHEVCTIFGKGDILRQPLTDLLFTSGSKVTRSGVLAFAVYVANVERLEVGLHYLGLCYEQLRSAIANGVLVDIIFGSYLAAKVAGVMEDLGAARFHISGLRQAMRSLVNANPSALGQRECRCIEQMSYAPIAYSWESKSTVIDSQSPQAMFRPEVESVLINALPRYFIECEAPSSLLSQPSESSFLSLSYLTRSFYYHFALYLWRTKHPIPDEAKDEKIAGTLQKVIQQLVYLLPQHNTRLSHDLQNLEQTSLLDFASSLHLGWNDCQYYSTYFTLTLINIALFLQPSNETDNLAKVSAVFLCRTSISYSVSERSRLWDLLLAGLILTNTRHAAGSNPFSNSFCSHIQRMYGLGGIFEIITSVVLEIIVNWRKISLTEFRPFSPC
jgi:hypothetical protein